MSNKNKDSWNKCAAAYSAKFHTESALDALKGDPWTAFHSATRAQIQAHMPDLSGARVCVPSSGDNMAVFAFALMGARVTSCDIAENQLINASRVAKARGWDGNIEFVCTDTMRLDGIADGAYDFVYTSNGVHVWINDLGGMYNNIYLVMKPGGVYIMHEIHPFQRPFDDGARVIKPYDEKGPFDDGDEITYHWRMMDIINAIIASGLRLVHMEEMPAEKNYAHPFWLSLDDVLAGVTATREEVDSMHDWRVNPMAALPNWLCAVAQK